MTHMEQELVISMIKPTLHRTQVLSLVWLTFRVKESAQEDLLKQNLHGMLCFWTVTSMITYELIYFSRSPPFWLFLFLEYVDYSSCWETSPERPSVSWNNSDQFKSLTISNLNLTLARTCCVGEEFLHVHWVERWGFNSMQCMGFLCGPTNWVAHSRSARDTQSGTIITPVWQVSAFVCVAL